MDSIRIIDVFMKNHAKAIKFLKEKVLQMSFHTGRTGSFAGKYPLPKTCAFF